MERYVLRSPSKTGTHTTVYSKDDKDQMLAAVGFMLDHPSHADTVTIERKTDDGDE